MIYKTSEDGEGYQEYEYTLSPNGLKVLNNIEELEKKNIVVYADLRLPSNWGQLSYIERKTFLIENSVDLEVQSVFCRSKCLATDLDIDSLKIFKDITTLHISGENLTVNCLKVLAKLPCLQTVNISGAQFGDEAIKHLLKLESLKLIDLYNTAVSPEGFASIGAKFKKQVELYC